MKLYFKVCLLMPLWLPAVLGLFVYLINFFNLGIEYMIPDQIAGIGFLLVVSALLGGVQYCIALLIIWRRIDFELPASFINGVVWLPVIFMPIQILGMLPFALTELFDAKNLLFLYLIAFFDLVIGYAYVAIWLLGLGLIQVIQRTRKVAITL